MITRKVGVLISIYANDYPNLFESALVSIINQNLPKGFISKIYLGVDGPITVELEDILNRYSKNVHCISRSAKNIGLASTLNRLLSLRENEEYLFRMDADDFSYPNRFAAQINKLESCPDIDILGTSIRECYPNGKRKVVKFANGHEDARSKIYIRVPVAHPTVCFRKRVFDVVGNYPIRPGNEDIALWFKCIKLGFRFDNLEETYLDFNISSNFWSRRSFRKAIVELYAYTEGIFNLDGITWKLILPFARFIFRFFPDFVIRFFYTSRFRNLMRNNN